MWPAEARSPQMSPGGFARREPPVGATHVLPPSVERETPGMSSATESANPATWTLRLVGLLVTDGSTCGRANDAAFVFTRVSGVKETTLGPPALGLLVPGAAFPASAGSILVMPEGGGSPGGGTRALAEPVWSAAAAPIRTTTARRRAAAGLIPLLPARQRRAFLDRHVGRRTEPVDPRRAAARKEPEPQPCRRAVVRRIHRE